MKRRRALITSMLSVLAVAVGLLLWTPDRPWPALESRWLRAPSDLIELQGTRVHVRDEGPRDRPALLMVHGLGSSLQTWDVWAQTLQAHYRVIRLDLPGHGLSGPDATGDYRDERSRALINALLDRKGLERITLIGHSIGGRIAWGHAAAHPERVAALILVAPDGFASPGFEYGRAPDVPRVMDLMQFVLPRFVLRANLEPAYAQPTTLDDALVDRYFDLLRAPGNRAALLQRMRQTVLTDPIPALGRIRMPVLLVWGDRDRMIPISNAQDYLTHLPQATLLRRPGIGHLPQEEDADTTADEVDAWLSRLP